MRTQMSEAPRASDAPGEAERPHMSVIIATKDRARLLAHALESLAQQRAPFDFEVIVVDNGSADETPALLDDASAAAAYRFHAVRVERPNRAAARNAGIAAARGALVAFVDDDISLPPGFLAAHAAAHANAAAHAAAHANAAAATHGSSRAGGSAAATGVSASGPVSASGVAVSGPIVNVPSYAVRPPPRSYNYSRAFFCTCNVSVPRRALEAVGGFDESFDLYGWEDTELGLRLRRAGVTRAFAWDAYLWHIKPPDAETLDVVHAKTLERARMAARLLRKDASLRTKLATGAYTPNLVRSTLLAPPWSLGAYRAVAVNERLPKSLRAVARAQYLDGSYTSALRRARREMPT